MVVLKRVHCIFYNIKHLEYKEETSLKQPPTIAAKEGGGGGPLKEDVSCVCVLFANFSAAASITVFSSKFYPI